MEKVNGTWKTGMNKNNYAILLSWNLYFRFCGWVDVGLSPLGVIEAEKAAKSLAESGLKITKIYTSLLKRAQLTVQVCGIKEGFLRRCSMFYAIAKSAGIKDEEIIRDWRLNERHYGSLTGLNKGLTNDIITSNV